MAADLLTRPHPALTSWLRFVLRNGTPLLYLEGMVDVAVLQHDPTRPFDLVAVPSEVLAVGVARQATTVIIETPPMQPGSWVPAHHGRVVFRGDAPVLADWEDEHDPRVSVGEARRIERSARFRWASEAMTRGLEPGVEVRWSPEYGCWATR